MMFKWLVHSTSEINYAHLVLVISFYQWWPIVTNRKMQEKFKSEWEGPCIFTKRFPAGTYECLSYNGQILYSYINGKLVKKIFTHVFGELKCVELWKAWFVKNRICRQSGFILDLATKINKFHLPCIWKLMDSYEASNSHVMSIVMIIY